VFVRKDLQPRFVDELATAGVADEHGHMGDVVGGKTSFFDQCAHVAESEIELFFRAVTQRTGCRIASGNG
jgi:hypothetical protein